MVKATAVLVCTRCLKRFEVHKTVCNSGAKESFIRWAEQNIKVCRDCEHAAQSEQAAAAAKAAGLPDLQGSPKQVAWAMSIRAEKLEALNRYMRESVQEVEDSCDWPKSQIMEYREIMSALIQDAETVTSAKAWIDWRGDTAEQIFVDLRRIHKAKEGNSNEMA